jgi:isochorismate synthase
MSTIKDFISPDIFTADHAFALYRLPGRTEIVGIKQQGAPTRLHPNDLTEELSGYLIYPFQVGSETPILLIRPQEVVTFDLPDVLEAVKGYAYTSDEQEQREVYRDLFELAHRQIRAKGSTLKKVVLSRQLHINIDEITPSDYLDIFLTACTRYPQSFIALWYTPESGLWLVATPECLLEKVTSTLWRTMALAGTMTWDAGAPMAGKAYWSPKDKREQNIVAEYLHDTLQPYAEYIERSHTYPVRAGELAHLRTDFTFSIRMNTKLGELINEIHPTPAVCGLPKDDALICINRVEGPTRSYYSGFSGPLNLDYDTRFYVSLRCMQAKGHSAILYAGGGLLRDSDEDIEWTETERKLRTILSLFEEEKQEEEDIHEEES